jgi:hypothetical protein
MSGVYLNGNGADSVFVRGMTTNRCVASIYIDGARMPGISADEIDGWVRPEEIAGIEVYTGLTAPPQFVDPFNRCGAIVIWTTPAARARPRLSFRQYGSLALVMLGIIYLTLRVH